VLLFISDLHLSAETPRIARRFEELLAGPVREADGLFILGDLFEYWAGDDDGADPFNARMLDALRAATAAGTPIHFLAGNRDFLIGEGFSAATGVKLLSDPYVLSVPAWQFVLSHGDALCTDDQEYQAFRQQVRNPDWQRRFLELPLAERKRQIAAIRQRSEQTKREKSAAIMDVNPGATEDFLRDYGYATLIHGHTHRPATHDHIVDGIHCQRWVLSDWHEDAGEVLVWDGTALERRVLP
jgi:UDP-2,3-diacylglucosamine hydrolase